MQNFFILSSKTLAEIPGETKQTAHLQTNFLPANMSRKSISSLFVAILVFVLILPSKKRSKFVNMFGFCVWITLAVALAAPMTYVTFGVMAGC